MTERHCTAPGCGKLLEKRPKEGSAFLLRGTCGRACQQKKKNARISLWRKTQQPIAKEPIVKVSPYGWPDVTGEVRADFSPFNHDPGDNETFRLLPPPTVVKTQSSIA